MELTTLMLADDAAQAGGKLYIHGGGWDVVHVTTVPATLPRLALVVIIKVEYDEALTEQALIIDLVDEDDQPAGGDLRVQGRLNVGHPPGSPRGAASFVAQTLRLEGLRFEQRGSYRFRVFAGDDQSLPLASLPFRLALAG